MINSTSGPNQSTEVKGTVRLADGSPVAGIKVSAFDRDLRTEQLLGQSQSKRDGSYLIQYSADAFAKAETGSAGLVVKAFATDGSLLASFPVLLKARSSRTIDVMIPPMCGLRCRWRAVHERLHRDLLCELPQGAKCRKIAIMN
jgi:hypothetical protein